MKQKSLHFDHSPRRFTELTESYYIHGYYLLKGEDWNQPKEKTADRG
jgi:hypothetical protein